MKIEGARVVFRVNNGNLIQFGSENLPAAGMRAPQATVTKRVPPARRSATSSAASFPATAGSTTARCTCCPVNVIDESQLEGYRFGDGRDLQLVWQFTFHRTGEPGTWRGRVDATSGEVIEFYDVNEYGAATGGTYQAATAPPPRW